MELNDDVYSINKYKLNIKIKKNCNSDIYYDLYV